MKISGTIHLASLSFLCLQAIAIQTSQIHLKLHDEWSKDTTPMFVWGAALPIPNADKLTNGQIVDLAFTAHQAMRENNDARPGLTQSKALAQLPTVITVVVSGNYAYISSSLKGGPILYSKTEQVKPDGGPDGKKYWKNPNNLCPAAITDGLRQCNKPMPNDDQTIVGHTNGGACGEVMVAWMMCEMIQDARSHPARVVAVEYKPVTPGDRRGPKHMVIKDPCGDDTPGNWNAKGCQTFTQHFGWQVIPANTARGTIGDLTIAASAVKYPQYNIQGGH